MPWQISKSALCYSLRLTSRRQTISLVTGYHLAIWADTLSTSKYFSYAPSANYYMVQWLCIWFKVCNFWLNSPFILHHSLFPEWEVPYLIWGNPRLINTYCVLYCICCNMHCISYCNILHVIPVANYRWVESTVKEELMTWWKWLCTNGCKMHEWAVTIVC